MRPADPVALVHAFNACIDARDAEALAALMTDDHVFIDSAGHFITGREPCRDAWQRFFDAFPDYRNRFDTVTARDATVTVTGRSSCSDPRLDGRAIWQARIEGGKLAEWRVYEDTAPNRALLGVD